jgi:hypothetical protein
MNHGCGLGTDRLRRRQPQRCAGLHECRRQAGTAAPICGQLLPLLLLLKLELLLLLRVLLLLHLLLLKLLHLHCRLVWLRHAREQACQRRSLHVKTMGVSWVVTLV